MQIAECYSHLNGLEYVLLHNPLLWEEVKDIITLIDAEACKTKVSKEKTMSGRVLYSPTEINKRARLLFHERGWRESRYHYWITKNAELIRKTMSMDQASQRKEIDKSGEKSIRSYNQTDFVKERVAVEFQLGKYAFIAFDIFVKHMSFYVGNVIDVGVEILPMKEFQDQMSSGVGYYESGLYNLLRLGRGSPAVPLILVGISH